MIPIGLFWPRNATAIPVNPSIRHVVRAEVPGRRQDLLHPDEPGERTRDQEQADLRRPDRDAARAGGAVRGAHRARLVAQARPTEQEPDDTARRDRQEEQPGEMRPGADRRTRVPRSPTSALSREDVRSEVDVLPRRTRS